MHASCWHFHSWGPSWGLRGTFRIAYGAALIMPNEYTYAIQFGPSDDGKIIDVKKLLRQGSTRPAQSDNATDNCVMYQAFKAMRLVKLHDMLITLASSQLGYNSRTKAQVLSDLISSNLGHVADITAANTTFRVCGTARQLLSAGVLSDGSDAQLEALLSIKTFIDKTGVLQWWSKAAGANGSYCDWQQINCNNGSVVDVILWTGSGVEGLQGSLPPADALQGLTQLTTLNIGGQHGITGTLPADWGQLQQLQQIILVNGSLTGQVPTAWGSLAGLTALSLYQNRLTGPIPESLGSLTKLDILSLSTNALTGKIPDSMGNLRRLTVLQLYENQLSGPIPDSLAMLTRLGTLHINDNALSGTIPASLGSMRKLLELHAWNNQLRGSIPGSLGGLASLTSLWISANFLTSTIPASLGNLQGLSTLSLSDNSLSGRIPDALGSLTKLNILYLSANTLTGTLPGSLGNLTNLTDMQLHFNRLHGPLPDSFQKLTKLTDLAVANNTLTGSVPPSWSNMTQLREVYMWHNPGLVGCLPASWQAQLAGFDLATDVYDGTNITGFCTS